MEEIIAKLCSSYNEWHNGAVTSWILALLGDESIYVQYVQILKTIQILDMKIKDYIKISKMIHDTVRKTGVDSNLKVMSIEQRVNNQYLQDLASRATFTTDWYEDVKERTTDGWIKLAFDGQKFSPIEFIRRRRKNLKQMYMDMEIGKIQPDTLLGTMLRREQFVKAGSSLSSTSTIIDLDGKEKKVRLDKRQAVQWMTAEDICLQSQRLPQCILAGINKMENGKNRLLLTTDTIHYLLGEYLLQPVEQRLDRKVKIDEPKEPIDKLNFKNMLTKQCQQKRFFQSFDWDNFNIQHTVHDMQDVWLSLRQVVYEKIYMKSDIQLLEKKAIKDYMRVCEWYALSMNNMWLRSLPDNKILDVLISEQNKDITNNHYIEKPPSELMDDRHAKRAGLLNRTSENALLLTQGLASGRRDTNHTNTMLNVAQATQVMQDMQSLFPEYEKMIGERMHKGDDIAVELQDQMVGIIMLMMMRICGQNGQGSKLIMGDGEFEFLRQFYANDGTIRGYLRRSIPNAVSTDYQGEQIDRNDPEQLISAMTQQCQKLKTRGMDQMMCDLLEDQMIRTWSKPRKYSQIQVGINSQRLNASVIDGGLGLCIRGKMPRRATIKPKQLTDQDRERLKMLEKLKQIKVHTEGIVGEKKAAVEYLVDIKTQMPWQIKMDNKMCRQIIDTLADQDAKNSLTKLQKENMNMVRKKLIEEEQIRQRYQLKEIKIIEELREAKLRSYYHIKDIQDTVQKVIRLYEEDKFLLKHDSVMLNLQKQVARIDIKKREVLQIMYDTFLKKEDLLMKQYGQIFKNYTLEIFIGELNIDQTKKKQILEALRAARQIYTDKAIYRIVFKNVSFDQVMTLDIHEDIMQYYRQYSICKAEQWLKVSGRKLSVVQLQLMVRAIEIKICSISRNTVSQCVKFKY